MKRLPVLGGLLLAVSCASPAGTPPAATHGPVDVRWRLKAGDVFTIRLQVVQSGDPDLGGLSTLEGTLRIEDVGPAGEGNGTFLHTRFELKQTGIEKTAMLFEDGKLKQFKGEGIRESRDVIEKRMSTPLPVILDPKGMLRPKDRPEIGHLLLYGPIGIHLPGKKAEPSDRWRGVIRAAHCDALETEYRFARDGGNLRITGRSTPKAEKDHKIRVRQEGTYLAVEGYVSESTLVIDFSPLEMDLKITARTSISRNRR